MKDSNPPLDPDSQPLDIGCEAPIDAQDVVIDQPEEPVRAKRVYRKKPPTTEKTVKVAQRGLVKEAKKKRNSVARVRGGKITQERYDLALAMLMQGVTIEEVTRQLKLSRSAIWVRAHDNPAFSAELDKALAGMTYAQLEMAESALMGGEFSTGDVVRDKAIAEHFRWKVSKLFKARFGDKPLFEANTLNISFPDGMDKLI